MHPLTLSAFFAEKSREFSGMEDFSDQAGFGYDTDRAK